MKVGCHLPMFDSMLLESRYRDLPDMLTTYETFARDIRPRI